MDQRDFRREELVDAVLQQRMRLPTANFHDIPGLRGNTPRLLDKLTR
jgi:hypothetical protein